MIKTKYIQTTARVVVNARCINNNKIFRHIIFSIFFLVCFLSQFARADYTLDDSCTQTTSIMNRIVDDITTLGLFEAYSENFHMYGADGYGGSSSDGVNGCNANYYPDDCPYDNSVAETTGEPTNSSCNAAYIHNDTYCQPDGTNCCQEAIDPSTGLPSTQYVGVPCPSGSYQGECSPNGGLEYCFDNLDWETLITNCNGNNTPVWSYNGDYAWFLWPSGQLRTVTDGDKLCVQFATTIGYENIGCKYIPACSQFYLDQFCYVAPSCYTSSARYSQAYLPITSAIIQCINDTISYLFNSNSSCSTQSAAYVDTTDYIVTTFSSFQGQMRNTVRMALMLYLVLFGLKITLSSAGKLPSKAELFKMGAKFILVLYFSTGIQMNDGQVGTDGQPYYDDGIHRYMLPLYTSGASELADWVYTAGGDGVCNYNPDSYVPGSYSYLSMWDGIDCRILYYLGVNLYDVMSYINGSPPGGTSSNPMNLSVFGESVLLGLLLPAFFSFQLLFLFCTILFTIMFFSITIYFVNITIISAILVAILIYIAPIFVPMALFESTKDYYEGWLKTVTSYALQPMVVAAYFAMMITIFDQTMFGDCVFQNYPVYFEIGGYTLPYTIPFFMLCDPHDSTSTCYNCTGSTGNTEGTVNVCPDYATTADTASSYITQCSQTIGYYLNPIQNVTYTNVVDMIFFDITMLNTDVANNMMLGVVTLALFAFIFYKFADVISEFSSLLTGGGSSLGSSVAKPMALVDKAGSLAKDLAKYAANKKDNPKSNAKSSTSDNDDKKRSGATSSTSDIKDKKSKSDKGP